MSNIPDDVRAHIVSTLRTVAAAYECLAEDSLNEDDAGGLRFLVVESGSVYQRRYTVEEARKDLIEGDIDFEDDKSWGFYVPFERAFAVRSKTVEITQVKKHGR